MAIGCLAWLRCLEAVEISFQTSLAVCLQFAEFRRLGIAVAQDYPSLKNQLLATLPQLNYEQLLPHLERVSLTHRQVLYEPNQPINYAYFPLNAVVSLFNLMGEAKDKQIETTIVGSEGMIGVPLVLGTNQIPMQAVVQIPGEALRISAEAFRSQIQWGSPLYALLLRYTQTLVSQISQTVSCNRLHAAEERCCFILAITQDRIGSAELLLTQETLAVLVGVRRASASSISNTLERAGLIHHQRGKITILDRAGLEAAACDCYRVLKAEFDHLLN